MTTYREAGVDIESGKESVRRILAHAERTRRPGALGALGGFGGLFQLDLARFPDPVLVAGTDGVGTKLRVAFMAGRHDTIGRDCVAMCANDVVAQAAEPLFFLDYISVGRRDPAQVEQIVRGVADGCLEAGCALIGGETAEMPGFYPPGEYDIAGFCVGAANRGELVDGAAVRPGWAVVGLGSSGLHSNGYSLARRVFFHLAGWKIDRPVAELGRTLGDELLEPTRIYVRAVLGLLRQGIPVGGIAHITGGGLTDNVPRALPAGCRAVLRPAAWPEPPVFGLLRRLGRIEEAEMRRTFNLGVGMALFVPPERADAAVGALRAAGELAWIIGEVVAGERGVTYA